MGFPDYFFYGIEFCYNIHHPYRSSTMKRLSFCWLTLTALLLGDVTITTTGVGGMTTEISGTHSVTGVTFPVQLPVLEPPLIERPIRRPIIHNNLYVNNVTIDPEVYCRSYIEMIDERDAYIDELEKKLTSMQLQLQTLLSQHNKAQHEKEMKALEKRNPSIQTKSKIIISDKPGK
jgi:TolA-binding protein